MDTVCFLSKPTPDVHHVVIGLLVPVCVLQLVSVSFGPTCVEIDGIEQARVQKPYVPALH